MLGHKVIFCIFST